MAGGGGEGAGGGEMEPEEEVGHGRGWMGGWRRGGIWEVLIPNYLQTLGR